MFRESSEADVLQGLEHIFALAMENFPSEQKTDFEIELLMFAERFEASIMLVSAQQNLFPMFQRQVIKFLALIKTQKEKSSPQEVQPSRSK